MIWMSELGNHWHLLKRMTASYNLMRPSTIVYWESGVKQFYEIHETFAAVLRHIGPIRHKIDRHKNFPLHYLLIAYDWSGFMQIMMLRFICNFWLWNLESKCEVLHYRQQRLFNIFITAFGTAMLLINILPDYEKRKGSPLTTLFFFLTCLSSTREFHARIRLQH